MRARIAVGALALSASAFVALIQHEGYTDNAVVPVKGDVPTVGFGTTKRDDGTPVRMGDKTTPVRAVVRAAAHVSSEEERFRASLPGVALHQAEYDLYLDFLYQYGSGTWANSSMRRHLLAGEHRKACDALLLYRKVSGYDCSTPGNRRCPGVWSRQQERHEKCLAAQ